MPKYSISIQIFAENHFLIIGFQILSNAQIPRLEVCNVIEVKNVPPHRRVVKEEPREKEGLKKKKEPNKNDVKKIKEDVASVKTKEQKPPVKTKKMTTPENKPVPKMVRKWVPKIAKPAKSVNPD
jgi:hypothetical protein